MKKILALAVVLFGLSSCSTMFNSGSQTVLVHPTDPDGEGVVVNITTPSGAYRAKLPSTIVVAPSTFSKIRIKVAQKCYEPSEVTVNEGVTLSYFMNIFNGIGFFIDLLDGYMWKYDSQTMIPVMKTEGCDVVAAAPAAPVTPAAAPAAPAKAAKN